MPKTSETQKTERANRLKRNAWLVAARGAWLLCAAHGMQRVTGHTRAEDLRLACGCTRPSRVTDPEEDEREEAAA